MKSYLETEVDKVTVGELEKRLAACALFLNSKLKQEFDIGFVPKKSSKWIAELALPYLYRTPETYFTHDVDTDGGLGQSPLTSKSHNYVIFDDCSYSGMQLSTIVHSMHKALQQQNKKGKLFIVIPFISVIAENALKRAWSLQPAVKSKLKVHFITTNRKLKTIEGNTNISFTEWKVPDNVSIDQFARVGRIKSGNQTTFISLLTDYPPCYKS